MLASAIDPRHWLSLRSRLGVTLARYNKKYRWQNSKPRAPRLVTASKKAGRTGLPDLGLVRFPGRASVLYPEFDPGYRRAVAWDYRLSAITYASVCARSAGGIARLDRDRFGIRHPDGGIVDRRWYSPAPNSRAGQPKIARRLQDSEADRSMQPKPPAS